MIESKDGNTMQGAPLQEADEWAMPERREREVMRDMPGKRRPPVDDYKFPTPRGVLSKAEIEALLRPDLPTINDTEAPQPGQDQPVERAFDDVELLGAEGGKRLAARLSLIFAQATGLKAAFRFRSSARVNDVEAALVETASDATAAYICYGAGEDTVTHVLQVPETLGAALVSHACGGVADLQTQPFKRAFSAIDCALIEQLLAPLRAAFDPETGFIGVETEHRFVGALVPGQSGERVRFQVVLNDEAIELDLLVTEAQKAVRSEAGPSEQPRKRPVTAVVTARLASLNVPVSKLTGLKAGDTLLLGLPADQPVQLLSGGRDGVPAFEGDIGRKGNNMAIRIRKTFNS
ncbi:FliM/FliN family flagellar motor switch protein [Henriciella mobilis]|uniref:Flagellar motor switch protein FliN-like C-terminal domain-containing protein n=1 Tax=Henriciella mobilis TaxID=2305467 RepID=A0A399RAR4_9PROT|nr:FliM/FliN family flagellar motor switch protein [Henriciella mobilis]RIJ27067.1 hypothetical protein D1223_14615 [Henriciella mobilis]